MQLEKVPTGILGLDDVLAGGLPHGRATLVFGSAGAGKTLLATEFLVRGCAQGEPGVLISFEESHDDLVVNAASLGFDLAGLERDRLLVIDHIGRTGPTEQSGDYDLEGLFLRIGASIDAIGARRVVVDTVQLLFSTIGDGGLVRRELRRLLSFLRSRGVTVVVTAETADVTGSTEMEEFVVDCTISLSHEIAQASSGRRIQVRKYRGSSHAAYPFPFYISDEGIKVLPLATNSLDAAASSERFSTGVDGLDDMLGGGVFKGTTALVTGGSGLGKSSLAGQIVDAACRRGESAVYISFEESPEQIVRNFNSIGLSFGTWVEQGLLRLSCHRASGSDLERQFGELEHLVRTMRPSVVVIDPVSAFEHAGTTADQRSMLMREIDFLKQHGITAVLTSLVHDTSSETTGSVISSLVDTWFLLKIIQGDAERNRGLYILKSRGMAHSNQIREFVLTSQGIVLRDVYVGTKGVLTGTARAAREAEDRAELRQADQEIRRLQMELDVKRARLESDLAEMRRAFASEAQVAEAAIAELMDRSAEQRADRDEQSRLRQGPASSDDLPPGPADALR